MILAADLGGTSWKLAIMQGGVAMAFDEIPHVTDEVGFNRLPKVYAKLLDKVGCHLSDCGAFGISLPEIVDPVSKRVQGECFKHLYLQGKNIEDFVRQVIDLPVFVDNDARVALQGEIQFGVLEQYPQLAKNSILVTLGTGIGVAVCSSGQLLVGHNARGSILAGHTTVANYGVICPCGNRDCAEILASGSAIKQNTLNHAWANEYTKYTQQKADFAALCGAIRNGNRKASEMLDQIVEVWVSLCVNLIHSYNPKIIVLSGGLTRSADLFIDLLKEKVAQRVWDADTMPLICLSKEPEISALRGAEAIAWVGLNQTKTNSESLR